MIWASSLGMALSTFVGMFGKVLTIPSESNVALVMIVPCLVVGLAEGALELVVCELQAKVDASSAITKM
ncbi:hypothetical protein GCM10023085_06930 [Actinomadura viridis]